MTSPISRPPLSASASNEATVHASLRSEHGSSWTHRSREYNRATSTSPPSLNAPLNHTKGTPAAVARWPSLPTCSKPRPGEQDSPRAIPSNHQHQPCLNLMFMYALAWAAARGARMLHARVSIAVPLLGIKTGRATTVRIGEAASRRLALRAGRAKDVA